MSKSFRGAVGAVLLAVLPSMASAAPVESELTAPGPLAALHGTLVDAGKGAPVVVIVPGSGPTDRNGNNPYGIKAQSYRLLAGALAARGISSVRIDKRGMFGSKAAIADANAVTIADYAGDVRAWAKAARAATGARCVWLLGHSEGGLVVLAAGDAPDVCGFILVSAAGRPFATIIHEQIHASADNSALFDQADAALARIEAGEHVDVTGMHPALLALFNPAVQDYLIDLTHHDPAALAARTRAPMLIVQGANDIQISEADARALAAARPDATLVVLAGVNHALKQIGDVDRAANVASYADPDLPIDPGVTDAIAGFIASHKGK